MFKGQGQTTLLSPVCWPYLLFLCLPLLASDRFCFYREDKPECFIIGGIYVSETFLVFQSFSESVYWKDKYGPWNTCITSESMQSIMIIKMIYGLWWGPWPFGWTQGHFIDMFIKESIYDHHNYKGWLSTCTLKGFRWPLEDVSNKQVKPYSLHYQEYMWFIVGTWTLFNITSELYRGGDEALGALLLVTATVQEHHKYEVISNVPDTYKIIID